MKLPINVPTDNIYKTICIGGLILYIVAATFYFSMSRSLNGAAAATLKAAIGQSDQLRWQASIEFLEAIEDIELPDVPADVLAPDELKQLLATDLSSLDDGERIRSTFEWMFSFTVAVDALGSASEELVAEARDKKNAPPNAEIDQLMLEVGQLVDRRVWVEFFNVIMFFSLPLALIGFWLWYFRTQHWQDLRDTAHAAKLSQEVMREMVTMTAEEQAIVAAVLKHVRSTPAAVSSETSDENADSDAPAE